MRNPYRYHKIIINIVLIVLMGVLVFVFIGRLPYQSGNVNNTNSLKPGDINTPPVNIKNNTDGANKKPTPSLSPVSTPTPTSIPTPSPLVTPTPAPTPQEKDVLLNVPFVSQAPFGNWSDPMQENGCEEASAIMAMAWVKGTPLTREGALKSITDISNYEQEKYGSYVDTDAEDTVTRIFNEYFQYDNVAVRHDIGIEDIKIELFKGNLVLVPVRGRELGNPFYTPPGPITHMLVIKGYDVSTGEFITNDAGTRHGENYRYDENIMANALLDYPTGDHEPVTDIRTAMIIVYPAPK